MPCVLYPFVSQSAGHLLSHEALASAPLLWCEAPRSATSWAADMARLPFVGTQKNAWRRDAAFTAEGVLRTAGRVPLAGIPSGHAF